MKMSKASDYALVFLAKLSAQPKENWLSVKATAETLKLPVSFLGNIVHKLVQSGILESQRGVHGGVRLAKEGDQISIGAVLEAMNDPLGIVDCIDQPGDCPIERCCEIKSFWSITHGLILSSLKGITLKDISTYLGRKQNERAA